jgi:hypothetical protein
MYLSKVTRPGTFTWSLGMKLRFICCDGVPRCQTLGSERASRYAASADRLEAWQFTEVPAVELRDDAMCQVTKVCLQGCNITPTATNIALRPKPNRSAFDSSKHCRNFSNPQWFASLFTLVQHKFTSHTERALQFRLRPPWAILGHLDSPVPMIRLDSSHFNTIWAPLVHSPKYLVLTRLPTVHFGPP